MLRRPASCLKNHFYTQQQSPAKRKNQGASRFMVKFGPGSGSTTSKRPQNGLGNPAIFSAFLSTTRKVLDSLSLKPLPCFKRMCVLPTSRNHKIVVVEVFFQVSNIQQMATPRIFGDFLDENNRWNRRTSVVQVMSSLTELQTRQSELMAQQAEMNRWFPQTGFGFQEGRFSPQKKKYNQNR